MARYNIDYFLSANEGQYMDFDGSYGNQCVDLFNYYNQQVVGAPWIGTPLTGGAVDLWNNFNNSAAPGYYRPISNTPDGVPRYGDVMIWDANVPRVTGPAGHVSIFLEGDVHQFTSFDQNYPTGSACHHQHHSDYTGVLGWLRPIMFEPAPTAPPPVSPPVPPPVVSPPPVSVPVDGITPPVLSPPSPQVPPYSPPAPTNEPPVETTKPRLPDRDSATGRSIATLIQTGFATLGMSLLAFFLDPHATDVINQYAPWFVPVLPIAVAVTTFINNVFRDEIKKY